MSNFLMYAVLSIVAVVIVLGLTRLFLSENKASKLLLVVAKYLPGGMDALQEIIGLYMPESLDTIKLIDNIVERAVVAVEQISSNKEMTSEEKKELAITYFYELAAQFGLNCTEDTLTRKTVEIFIENMVARL